MLESHRRIFVNLCHDSHVYSHRSKSTNTSHFTSVSHSTRHCLTYWRIAISVSSAVEIRILNIATPDLLVARNILYLVTPTTPPAVEIFVRIPSLGNYLFDEDLFVLRCHAKQNQPPYSPCIQSQSNHTERNEERNSPIDNMKRWNTQQWDQKNDKREHKS